MLEPTVDRLRGAVGSAGPVEEREDVAGALLKGAAQASELSQRGRDTAAEGVDDRPQQVLPDSLVGVAVGGDHALVDAPGRFMSAPAYS